MWPSGLWCAGVPPLLERVVFEASACVRLQPFCASRLMRGPWLVLSSFGSWRYSWPRWRFWKTWSRTVFSPSWRRPLGLLRQSQPRNGPCLPRFCGLGPARALPLPKAAPSRPHGSILLGQRGPTGLSVKTCPAAPPDRSVSSHCCSGSPASTAGLVEPRSAAGAALVSALSEPRVTAVDPSASAARPAAAEAKASQTG